MLSPVLEHLSQHTFTTTDLHRRLRLMQQCLEVVLYDEPEQMRLLAAPKRRERALEEIASAADTKVLMSLGEQIWDGFTTATVVARMKSLREEVETLPVMMLYIPVPFGDEQLKPLATWARREVAPSLMFEIEVDPAVVGGCAFVYNDTHYDWSLHWQMKNKRGLVTSLLNSYGHE